MTPSPHSPQPLTTAEQVEAWLFTTARKRLNVHLSAAEPFNLYRCQKAVMDMSDLVQEAMEEVRVINAELREGTKQLHTKTVELRERSARLLARSNGSQKK